MKFSVILPSIRPGFRDDTIKSAKDEADEFLLLDDPKKQYVQKANEGVYQTIGDVIVYLADRVVLYPGWRKKTEEAFEKINNSGVVSYFPNLVYNGAVTRDYIMTDLGGYLFYPEYLHYNCDQELGEVARLANKYVELLGLVKEFKEPPEKTLLNKDTIQHDGDLFREREKLGFPIYEEHESFSYYTNA